MKINRRKDIGQIGIYAVLRMCQQDILPPLQWLVCVSVLKWNISCIKVIKVLKLNSFSIYSYQELSSYYYFTVYVLVYGYCKNGELVLLFTIISTLSYVNHLMKFPINMLSFLGSCYVISSRGCVQSILVVQSKSVYLDTRPPRNDMRRKGAV